MVMDNWADLAVVALIRLAETMPAAVEVDILEAAEPGCGTIPDLVIQMEEMAAEAAAPTFTQVE
jgi:hypothetical protein